MRKVVKGSNLESIIVWQKCCYGNQEKQMNWWKRLWRQEKYKGNILGCRLRAGGFKKTWSRVESYGLSAETLSEKYYITWGGNGGRTDFAEAIWRNVGKAEGNGAWQWQKTKRGRETEISLWLEKWKVEGAKGRNINCFLFWNGEQGYGLYLRFVGNRPH